MPDYNDSDFDRSHDDEHEHVPHGALMAHATGGGHDRTEAQEKHADRGPANGGGHVRTEAQETHHGRGLATGGGHIRTEAHARYGGRS